MYETFDVEAADCYDDFPKKWHWFILFLQHFIQCRCGKTWTDFKNQYYYCGEQSLIRKKNKLYHLGVLENGQSIKKEVV